MNFMKKVLGITLGLAFASQSISFAGMQGVCTGSNVNARSGPGTQYSKIDTLNKSEVVEVSGNQGDWYSITLKSGKTVWVTKKYISVQNQDVVKKVKYEQIKDASYVYEENSSAAKGEEIVEYAKQFLGTKYKWGGTSLTSGVDCSGFTYKVMQNYGISLPHNAKEQSTRGSSVDKSNLQKGDLVFFDTDGGRTEKVNHVGMYIGNGQFIHASSSRNKQGVRIDGLNEEFYRGAYVKAVRVIR